MDKLFKTVDGVKVEMTEAEANELRTEWAANEQAKQDHENHYITKRIAEYPDIGDQLDMIYKDLKNGTTEWTTLIDNIKSKYPKEEVK